MPRPAGVTRFSLVGHLPGGEIFDTSFWVRGAQDVVANLQNQCDGIRDALHDSEMGYLYAILPPEAGYDTVRAYSYVDEGPAPANITAESTIGIVGTGSESGNGLLQTCLVATLQTALSGRRNRGRMYIPAPAVVVTLGLTDSSQPPSLAGALVHLFNAVNTDSRFTGPVSVVSSAGTHSTAVTAVRVDNHPDIQRRRADSLAPTASHTTVLGS